jgi:hypothetical protein
VNWDSTWDKDKKPVAELGRKGHQEHGLRMDIPSAIIPFDLIVEQEYLSVEINYQMEQIVHSMLQKQKIINVHSVCAITLCSYAFSSIAFITSTRYYS